MPAVMLDREKRMVFWEVNLFNKQKTLALSHVVSAISIKYETNMEAEATLEIMSESYIEDWFIPDVSVEINMGYDRTNLVPMFYGKIRTLPKGSGSDFLQYTVVAYGQGTEMALSSANKAWAGMTKAQIVHAICQNQGM